MIDEIPMPSAPTEEAVARWMLAIELGGLGSISEAAILDEIRLSGYPAIARAVLALCEAKVREALDLACNTPADEMTNDAIVARVMGKEAP